jgi:hypothetical protein
VIRLLDGFLPALTDPKGIWTLDGDALRWLGVLLTGVLISPLRARINAEKTFLRSQFGAEYEALLRPYVKADSRSLLNWIHLRDKTGPQAGHGTRPVAIQRSHL